MLFLQSEDPKADIHLYINSPGGSVTAGLAIYDTMQFVTCDVATYCIGQAASMGAVLLTAGAAGKRKALPNSRIMIHQPLAGMEGTAEDIMIHAKEFKKVKERLNRILIKHTGHPLEKIEQDTDRDRFMSAEEALEYGLIDQVIEHMELKRRWQRVERHASGLNKCPPTVCATQARRTKARLTSRTLPALSCLSGRADDSIDTMEVPRDPGSVAASCRRGDA